MLPPETAAAAIPPGSETSVSPETTVPETALPETLPPEAEDTLTLPSFPPPPTYNNIREYAASPDAPAFLREMTGLPDGYEEVLVETGGLYCITYRNNDSAIAFFPCESEAVLEEFMTGLLNTSGTYEFLLANDLVTAVRKTDLSSDGEIQYECLYNTSIKTDLKLQYREFTMENIRYVLSSLYNEDNVLQSRCFFVFDRENSFACILRDPTLTDTDLLALHSSVVTQ